VDLRCAWPGLLSCLRCIRSCYMRYALSVVTHVCGHGTPCLNGCALTANDRGIGIADRACKFGVVALASGGSMCAGSIETVAPAEAAARPARSMYSSSVATSSNASACAVTVPALRQRSHVIAQSRVAGTKPGSHDVQTGRPKRQSEAATTGRPLSTTPGSVSVPANIVIAHRPSNGSIFASIPGLYSCSLVRGDIDGCT
jgi:hypothetical protein